MQFVNDNNEPILEAVIEITSNPFFQVKHKKLYINRNYLVGASK